MGSLKDYLNKLLRKNDNVAILEEETTLPKSELQDDFFQKLKQLYISNGSLTKDQIYDFIVQYGVLSPETRDAYSFRGFSSNDENLDDFSPCIKMYIPTNVDSLEFMYKELDKFLKDNNIKNTSKFVVRNRFDNVVIRVVKAEDAQKIRNFISNNSKLKKSIFKNTQPFLASDDLGIRYIVDFNPRTSFNDNFSSDLKYYLDTADINTISKEGYIEFQKRYISDNCKKEYIMQTSPVKAGALFIQMMNNNFDYKKLEEYYDFYLRTTSIQKHNFDDALKYIFSKMKMSGSSDEEIIKKLNEYLKDESKINYFTRQDDIRNILKYFLPPYVIKGILNGQTIEEFYGIEPNNKKSDDNLDIQLNEKETLLFQASYVTQLENQNNPEKLKDTIGKYICDNDASGFSKTYELDKKIKQSISNQDVMILIAQTLLKINMISDVEDLNKIDPDQILDLYCNYVKSQTIQNGNSLAV